MAGSSIPGLGKSQSQLFTLRVWPEETGEGGVEWRARLHLISTGESAYFREWVVLLPLLLAMLRRAGVTIPPSSAPGYADDTHPG